MAAKEAKALAALEAQKAALLGWGGISEDDRARQLAALQQQEAAVRAGLASDREAAQARLRERLAARRAQGAAAAVLAGDAELPALQEEAEEEGPMLLPHSSDEEGPEAEEDEEAAEQRRRQQWLDGLLETSPMLKTLSDVQDLLRRIEGLPPPPCPNPGSFPAEGDARFRLEGRLQPSDLGSLSPAAVTTLEFGRLLVRLLREKEDGPDVVLELADTLPRNNYENNAFRRSFFFQHHPGVLFVRRKRAENVGDFMVILLHCLAHIAADELVDDESPRQRKLFYRVRHSSRQRAKLPSLFNLPCLLQFLRCVCRNFLFSPALVRNLAVAGKGAKTEAVMAAVQQRAAVLQAGDPLATARAHKADCHVMGTHQGATRFVEGELGVEHKDVAGRMIGLKSNKE